MSSAYGNKVFNPNTKWLVCLGDSITNSDWANAFLSKGQQYPKLLQQLIGGNCRERNLGVPGDKTDAMLRRMWDATLYTPTVAVIYGGINDNFQGMSTTQTQSNIQSMIDKFKSAGCSRIILCNIHTIPGTGGGSDSGLNPQRTIIQNLATSNSLPLCDLHAIGLVNPTDYYTDIIHPSASGMVKIANAVKSTIDAQGWTSILQN